MEKIGKDAVLPVLQSRSVRYNCEKADGGCVAVFTQLIKSPFLPFSVETEASRRRSARALFIPSLFLALIR